MEHVNLLKNIFLEAIKARATDLHLAVGEPPIIRVDGKLIKLKSAPFDKNTVESLILNTLTQVNLNRLKQEKEIDFSFAFDGSRIRANLYFEQGRIAAAFRFISQKIRTIQELGLPPVMERFAKIPRGLVIITGPTGHGKSTTMASIVESINENFSKHILTIEDPIEYVFQNKLSFVTQREYGSDTNSFARALRSSLREDPDVVLIGEMRDAETMSAALTIAETGHLVLTTLHTNSAGETPNRIIDAFQDHKQGQVRQQLASEISAIISQRLVPKTSGGRIPVCEIMIANSAIRSLIRENKTHQIENIIATSASEGMITLDKVLADLVSRGDIELDEALKWSSDPKTFKQMVY